MSTLIRQDEQTIVNSTFAYSTDSTVMENDGITKFAIAAVITDATPAAFDFATTDVDVSGSPSASIITETGHGMQTGLKGQFTTTGTLPAGLSTSTDYWIIRLTADTFQVASTLANAQAGTYVSITDQGSGTHTFTATSLSGTVGLYVSVDGTTYFLSGSTTNVTGDVNVLYEATDPAYRYFKVTTAITAGQVTETTKVVTWSE